jgi:hypothetical protein
MSLGSRIRDTGSGINLFRIPDPGVKKAPDPGSGTLALSLGVGTKESMRLVFNITFVNE